MPMPLAVLLAGGLGTRLGGLTEGLPKPMIEVAGRPFLEHILLQLAAQGFQQILLLVGHRAEVIESHFGDGSTFGLAIRYSREPEPMGTGGALGLAKPLIQDPFLLLYGDLYRTIDYAALGRGLSGNALAAYPYVEGLTTIACPNLGLAPDGRVTCYAKNRPDLALTHVDAGFGWFAPEVLDGLPEGKCSFEEKVYPALAQAGRLRALPVTRDFFDIGNPNDLAHARQWLRSSLKE